MENLNEIILVLKKLSLDGKGLYLDNIIELCNKDYNMERANVISKLNKGVDLNIIEKVENKYEKLSYRINKDAIKESKVSNTGEIFENDDTLSYIDKMYEEVKYKALNEKLLDDIKVSIKTYIKELETNEKFPDNESTILSETHDQKWYDTRIKSLEAELARKDDIIYNISKYFHNINSHNVPFKTQLPWELEDSDKSFVVLEDISPCDNKDETSSKKNDNTANPVVESNMKKLENQLIDLKKKYKERYYKDHFVKIKDISINNSSNALDDLTETNSENNNDINPKDSLKDSETKNSSIDKVVIYMKIKKKSVLVVGDSLLNGIEESKLSKDRHIRVQPISGAKIKDINNNLDELIHNDLKTIILHVGTNNSVEDTPEDIYNDFISLKTRIDDKIPNCQGLISSPIRRSDNIKANKTAEKVNNFIKLKFIENGNITDKYLGRCGLHLNRNGNIIFAET